jgi:hypothetical protein
VVKEKRNPKEGVIYKNIIQGPEAYNLSHLEELGSGILIVFEVEAELCLSGAGGTNRIGDDNLISTNPSHVHYRAGIGVKMGT